MDETQNDLTTLQRELYASPQLPGTEEFASLVIADFLYSYGCKSGSASAGQGGIEVSIGSGPVAATFHSELSGVSVDDRDHTEGSVHKGSSHMKGNDVNCTWLVGLAIGLTRQPLEYGTIRIVFASDVATVRDAGLRDPHSHPTIAARCDRERSVGMIGIRQGIVGPESHVFCVRLANPTEGAAVDSAGRLIVSLSRSGREIFKSWSASLRMLGIHTTDDGREAAVRFSVDYDNSDGSRLNNPYSRIALMVGTLMQGLGSTWNLTEEGVFASVTNDTALAALIRDVARQTAGVSEVYDFGYGVFDDAFVHLRSSGRAVVKLGVRPQKTLTEISELDSSYVDEAAIPLGVGFLRSVADKFELSKS